LVVVVPKVRATVAKTKHLYSLLSETNYSDGHWIDRASAALLRGDGVADYYNTFEQVAFEAFPGLKEDWLVFGTVVGRDVHLCGSGPGLFAVADDNHRAMALASKMIDKGYRAYAVGATGSIGTDAIRSRDGNLA
jgi:4-diphosphocytidyl-2C-methyl-D-erythritol kinase